VQTLGVGIIGYGFMGKVHTYDYRSLPTYYEPAPVRTKLVGVADAAPERVRLAVDVVGVEFSTGNWQELISEHDI
jgi:predicted dehydrogenase